MGHIVFFVHFPTVTAQASLSCYWETSNPIQTYPELTLVLTDLSVGQFVVAEIQDGIIVS